LKKGRAPRIECSFTRFASFNAKSFVSLAHLLALERRGERLVAGRIRPKELHFAHHVEDIGSLRRQARLSWPQQACGAARGAIAKARAETISQVVINRLASRLDLPTGVDLGDLRIQAPGSASWAAAEPFEPCPRARPCQTHRLGQPGRRFKLEAFCAPSAQ
jgi:hypothetical protein